MDEIRGWEERERERWKKTEWQRRALPCSCSWFCGDVTPKGDKEDDEGEVE